MSSVDRFEWERQLRDSPEVSGTRLLVLLTLATYMGSSAPKAWPSQATLAEVTGLGERAVRSHLTGATEDGWLERVRRGHRLGDGSTVSSVYVARIPQPAPGRRLTSTGTGPPVEGLNRHLDAPQPAPGRASTGTGVPPINAVEGCNRSEREPSADRSTTEPAPTLAALALPSATEVEEWEAAHANLVEDYGEDQVAEAIAALARKGCRKRWARDSEQQVRSRLGPPRSLADRSPPAGPTTQDCPVCVPLGTRCFVEHPDRPDTMLPCPECDGTGRVAMARAS